MTNQTAKIRKQKSATPVGAAICFLFSAFCFAASAASAADVLIDFEAGNDGDTITAAMMNASTHGSGLGAWSLAYAPSSPMLVSTDAEYVTSATYSGGAAGSLTGTRGFKCYLENDQDYFVSDFDDPHDNVTVAWYFKFILNGSSFAGFDMMFVEGSGGDFAVFNLNDKPLASGGPPFVKIHTRNEDETQAHIQLGSLTNTWLIANMEFRRNSTARLAIYNASTHVQIGETSEIPQDDEQAVRILLGRSDTHTDGPADFSYDYDDVAISFTGEWPLFPTNAPSNRINLLRITGG